MTAPVLPDVDVDQLRADVREGRITYDAACRHLEAAGIADPMSTLAGRVLPTVGYCAVCGALWDLAQVSSCPERPHP